MNCAFREELAVARKGGVSQQHIPIFLVLNRPRRLATESITVFTIIISKVRWWLP